MSLKRKLLSSVLALASLGLLAAGDCEFEVEDIGGWIPYYYDPYPVYYYEPVYYDPFYPCCF